METSKLKADQFISLKKAKELTGKFKKEKNKVVKDEYKDKNILPYSETFDKSVIDFLIKQPGCASIRIYFGMEENDQVSLVIVGVDANGNDILTPFSLASSNETLLAGSSETFEATDTLTDPIVENGTKCPPVCPTESPLNS